MFNDTYGHPAGDAEFREVASVLMYTVRPTDFVARYGGEEFVVILPDTPPEGALIVAERVRQAIELNEWHLRPITASLGVATADHGTDSAGLVDTSDAALYRAKQTGRNKVCHSGDSVAQAAA